MSNTEIERKFLCTLTDELSSVSPPPPCCEIVQAYICIGKGEEVRIRRKTSLSGQSYTLTCKSGSGIQRGEYEVNITEQQFDALFNDVTTRGRIIRKNRYTLRETPTREIFIDQFLGAHHGLFIAEIEFPSLEEANAYVPPAWCTTEVTDDASYKNSALATKFAQSN